MNQLKKLKEEMNLGRIIWIQSPSGGSALFFTKKLLNSLGIRNQDLVYLTARQFIRYTDRGLLLMRVARTILIGDVQKLSKKTQIKFFRKLSHYQTLKSQLNFHFLVISSDFFDFERLTQAQLRPYLFRLFDESHPIGINEKIHDFIESVSVELNKPIWGLSADAAHCLELAFMKNDEHYMRRLILEAVRHSTDKKILQQDLDFARQLIISYDQKNGLI